MSADKIEADTSCCASCGVAAGDDVRLKNCTACYLVKYCSVKCQKDHRPKHKRICKKRAAELRDELLFKQPESSHLGDCPICMLPMPLDESKSVMQACCSKVICRGCYYANALREAKASLDQRCPFCRKPVPSSNDEGEKYMMKRIEANDPVAMLQEGLKQYIKGEYSIAFEYYTKAAELGDVEAHVEKDKEKEIYHLEEAAIGGHPSARYDLGCEEEESGNIERAVKHWIISANLGDDESIKELMEYFKEGFVSKDDLAAALRAHKAAVDATKSPQREAAEEYYRILRDTIDAKDSN
eukprot:scaffold14678_cov75-Skeletonema_dohrnii-CCMP3373.AAC.3